MTPSEYPPQKNKPGKEKNGQPAESEQMDTPLPAEPTRGSAAEQPGTATGSPSKAEVVTVWTKPVTNQDEQEKITNAGGDDLPIVE